MTAAPQAAPPAISAMRLLAWSVRRELWENRSITIAPICAGGVVLFAFLTGAVSYVARNHASTMAVATPYDIAALMILFTVFLVAVFYCLDALYGERRERSVLFWKSLPVSDRMTVLSKVCIPMVVLPVVALAVIVATHAAMWVTGGAIRLIYGLPPRASGEFSLLMEWLVIAYGLVVAALWHAPIYGWLLLVSGWARRAPFLWAFLPLSSITAFEKIAFGTSHFSALIGRHFVGWASKAFVPGAKGQLAIRSLATLDPGEQLATPDLWLGLVVAALLIAAAIRLRRYREAL